MESKYRSEKLAHTEDLINTLKSLDEIMLCLYLSLMVMVWLEYQKIDAEDKYKLMYQLQKKMLSFEKCLLLLMNDLYLL